MNCKAKGTRAEHRAMRILEAAGYACCRSAASLGAFDIVAIGAKDVRLVQVKAGTKYASALEREAMTLVPVPDNATIEVWRFPDRCREPLIERLRPAAGPR